MIKESQLVIQAKEYISELLYPLKKKWFYYHNIDHTMDVYDRANYLMEKESIKNEYIELIQLAVLFHDCWFVVNYNWHEQIWANLIEDYLSWHWNMLFFDRLKFASIVNNYLNDFNIWLEKIEIIKHLILVTIPSRNPSNKLEQLIKDADMDNLWRDDFFYNWDLIRKELEKIENKYLTDFEWYKNTYQFIKDFKFSIEIQKIERNKKFSENIKKLEILIDELSLKPN